jgi:hypothetical protein
VPMANVAGGGSRCCTSMARLPKLLQAGLREPATSPDVS